jgi:hypothetical protein
MLCEFDSNTLRCVRCGFLATTLPKYRPCQTIEEEARQQLIDYSHRRINVPAIPIGSLAAAALKTIGITEQRVKKLIGRDCGCSQRRNTLDAIGQNVSAAIATAANRALDAVLPHPVSDTEVAAVADAIATSPLTNQGLKDKAAGR